ncbi:inositol monophosphatase family protein [Leucobacter sp. OH1287]|uniref:inositol monophosphatase family protein n=1 Tax=Leucobacter sp. OH1287 TaxID=2491049 RepID=UPI000F5E78DA|nr:inositol monophosphatase family protein [Leucobacter sp. OH1287]RRD60610.1 histidinol phosphatase [Leucobacter sp. OH1287]
MSDQEHTEGGVLSAAPVGGSATPASAESTTAAGAGSATPADLELALRLAEIAAEIALPRFRAADLRVSTKPDRTFVTDADQAVEAAIRDEILAQRPGDSFYGEETGKTAAAARQWIVDPIDGTSNFLRGVPNWATLIALVVNGEAQLGVVAMPALNTVWWALKGQGAFKQIGSAPAEQIHTSQITELADASLSFQSIQQWEEAGELDTLLSLRRQVWRDRAYGDAWSYMLLAEGLIDIVGEFDVKPYDLAAHITIVREAGGKITDYWGKDSIETGSCLASNGPLHSSIITSLHGQDKERE